MYNIRFLKSYEIPNAGLILHKIYIKELNWKFGINTPFNLRIHNIMLIDDNFYKGLWMGSFDEDRLIGCIHLNSRIKGLLETQHYQLHNITLNNILNRERKIIEINRVAIYFQYRGSGKLLLRMFLLAFKYALTHKLSIFFTTYIQSLINIFKNVGIYPLPDIKFKYELHDDHYVQCFLCKFEHHQLVISNIQKYLANL